MLVPNHPVYRSLWLPNELDVVAELVITAEMGQATARALCLTLNVLECLAIKQRSAEVFPHSYHVHLPPQGTGECLLSQHSGDLRQEDCPKFKASLGYIIF